VNVSNGVTVTETLFLTSDLNLSATVANIAQMTMKHATEIKRMYFSSFILKPLNSLIFYAVSDQLFSRKSRYPKKIIDHKPYDETQ